MRRWIPLAVLMFAACSNSAPPTVRDFQTALDQVECQGKLKCCAGQPNAYPDQATCESALAAGSDAKLTQVEADIAAGTARYDAGAAGRVLDAARGLVTSCDARVDVRGFVAELTRVVVGTAAPGAPCQDGHTQCAAGSQCMSGACVAQPAAGQACTGQNCAELLSCIAGACADPLADGAACAAGEECQSNRCDSGLCVAVTTAHLVCTL